MKTLTPKQKIFLQAIKSFFAKNGRTPTVRELREEVSILGLKLRSLRSIFTYLNFLHDKGYIEKNKKERGFKITGQEKSLFANIPIYGIANAGAPELMAKQNLEGFLHVSKKILGNKKLFAIRVSGDSMNLSRIKGKKIEDGDFVLVDPDYKELNSGDKVLAVIDGLGTIKTFKKITEEIVGLFPKSTNRKHRIIYLTSEDDLIINGKVIDVLKT